MPAALLPGLEEPAVAILEPTKPYCRLSVGSLKRGVGVSDVEAALLCLIESQPELGESFSLSAASGGTALSCLQLWKQGYWQE